MNKIYVLILFFCLACKEKTKVQRKEIVPDSIKAKLQILRIQNDSLTKIVKELNTNYWFDPEYTGDVFADKGINNPAFFVDSALRANPQLLPMKGVLGGTMQFDSIQLLSNKWLIANYSDGHILGKAIYEFKFKKDETVEFKILASMEDE